MHASAFFQLISCNEADKPALVDGQQTICYGTLLHEVTCRAKVLEGVSALALAMDNSVEWVLWDLAALKAGIPCVPVPPFFNETQISTLYTDAGVSHTLTEGGLIETPFKKVSHLPKGTAKVTFTSGTTDKPKGVCLSAESMLTVAQSLVTVLGSGVTQQHTCVLPLAVLLENVAGVYASLIAGSTVTIPSLKAFGTTYSNLHSVLKDSQATSAILMPELLRRLLGQIGQHGPLEHITFAAVGGAHVAPSLLDQAHQMGLPVYQGYGLSECASVVALNTPAHNKIGTVGQPLPHIRGTIKNGEIHIQNVGFLGYVGMAASSVVKTGDLGAFDEDGFLNISGRKKNVLITSLGRNISPEWIEATLTAQPAIAQALVYGDAQPSLSALIVPATEHANIQAAVYTANKQLPDYAQVTAFEIVTPFTLSAGTLTGTGRPRRKEILTLWQKEVPHALNH